MNPINRFLSIIAPHRCISCGLEGILLCRECVDVFEELPNICYACGKASRAALPCDKCKNNTSPQHVWIRSEYSGQAKELLYTYKFEYVRDAAPIIANLIAERLPYFAENPIITFVPTASRHRRERGFDHAELIANELARIKKWKYIPLLARVGQVRQLGSDREQRRRQLKDSFRPLRGVADGQILLVDDVLTTGATIEECTRVLKQAGARSVDAAVLARTPKK